MQCDNKDFLNRVRRLSGQITALEKMYDDRRTAQEIVQQIVAIRASLASLARLIVEAEVKGCLPSGSSGQPVSSLVDTLFKVS
ncbi:MAG: metal-sensing transcriptional repressor [Patescibacteria group bacterium]